MDSIHWGDKVDKEKAVKLRDFIEDNQNKHRCLQVGNFMFLFFEHKKDFRTRFRNNMKTSVLGSRPGLYIYQSKKTTKKTPRHGLKIGEAERLHERMQKHTRKSDGDFIGDYPGVVILKCTETRSSDEFNVHEMRKLCEILVNDFLEQAGSKFDTKGRPRVYVSKAGCNQAKDLIEALQKVVHKPHFKKIVGPAKKVNLKTLFSKSGV